MQQNDPNLSQISTIHPPSDELAKQKQTHKLLVQMFYPSFQFYQTKHKFHSHLLNLKQIRTPLTSHLSPFGQIIR